jgi:hypothetical protein
MVELNTKRKREELKEPLVKKEIFRIPQTQRVKL